jgi:hypothetical protein
VTTMVTVSEGGRPCLKEGDDSGRAGGGGAVGGGGAKVRVGGLWGDSSSTTVEEVEGGMVRRRAMDDRLCWRGQSHQVSGRRGLLQGRSLHARKKLHVLPDEEEAIGGVGSCTPPIAQWVAR